MTPLPPHTSDKCPLFLKCAYCSTCGIYNAHFAKNCPKRARGTLPPTIHLSRSWSNSSELPEDQKKDDDEDVPQPFYLASHTDIPEDLEGEERKKAEKRYDVLYKEYIKCHNLRVPSGLDLDGLREEIAIYLSTRNLELKSHRLPKSIVAPEPEEAEEEVVVVQPSPRVPKRKLRAIK